MSDNIIGGKGYYKGYESLEKFYKDTLERCPGGVTFKKDKSKVGLQFVPPGSDKRKSKTCDSDYSFQGIEDALDKAYKVKQALEKFQLASEFWEWYDTEILKKVEGINDLKTYRQIFAEIENKFWKGRNRNTGRKRNKDFPSDLQSYNDVYLAIFNKFPNWDKQPEWGDFEQVLDNWDVGTRGYSEAHNRCKKIASLSPNGKTLLDRLNKIDATQTEFAEKQSISLEEFLSWYDKVYDEIPYLKREVSRRARKEWLWVTAMIVLYGCRPSEIAAALNLDKPYMKDGVTIPAINDPSNKELLLVIGDFTYIPGVSTKTGERVMMPVTTDKGLVGRLHIQDVALPKYTPRPGSSPKTICEGFNHAHSDNIEYWGCPVTQVYAFRHLWNQLGEQYGIPQEIRSRSLGHSTTVNERTYKKRKNLKTTVDLLTKHSKQPLSLAIAKERLADMGVDLNDPSVKLILRVIYQLDE